MEHSTAGRMRAMGTYADFLRNLLYEGRIAFSDRPCSRDGERAEAERVLAEAFALHRRDVAGPPVAFDAVTALAAAEVVRWAAWFLLNRDEPAAEVARRLNALGSPDTAARHLSADLLLRYLPRLHRRARARAPADALTDRLADVLRHWPLSGVLSDVAEGPLTPLDLGGHRGLMQHYAERLARTMKPAWFPAGGAPAEVVELVFEGLGRGEAARLHTGAAAAGGAGGE